MSTKIPFSIVAYVDKKNPLQLASKPDFNIEQTYTLEAFINRMMKGDCSGLILDIHKVMSEAPHERNRIFAIASGYPLMRTKVDKYGNRIFIDNPDIFINFCNGQCLTNVRKDERIEIDIPAEISAEEDPAMAQSYPVTLKNISMDGCFIATNENLSEHQFLNIRLGTLSNKLPILTAIRWFTNKTHAHQGVGVKFIKILEEQREEIEKLYFS